MQVEGYLVVPENIDQMNMAAAAEQWDKTVQLNSLHVQLDTGRHQWTKHIQHLDFFYVQLNQHQPQYNNKYIMECQYSQQL
jgi:hypothetical protein